MQFKEATERFISAFGVNEPDSPIKPVGVKFIMKGEKLPGNFPVDDIRTTWCGAVKIASDGDPVVITKDNVGCPAGAIALGLVDPHEKTPLGGERKYTSLMKKPASPKDFTDGYVYACKGSDHMDFALFGTNDPGRYKTLEASREAVAGMTGINQEKMKAVIAYTHESSDLTPDVVILPLTPKQAMRAVQGYSYPTGKRVQLSTIGIRGVCADVTAHPYVHGTLNGSFFCLGARAIAGWAGKQLALGMPFSEYEKMVIGMEESQNGFPYKAFPA